MLLFAVSVLVVAQSSWEIPEGLMNKPVIFSERISKIKSTTGGGYSRICFGLLCLYLVLEF